MIKVGDCSVQLAGSHEEIRNDVYYIVKELIDKGIYDDAQELSLDVGRVAGLLNMSEEARLSMLFKYDIKATMTAKQNEKKENPQLMYEVGSDDE